MKKLLIICFVMSSLNISAQIVVPPPKIDTLIKAPEVIIEEKTVEKDELWGIIQVELMPTFPGGYNKMYKFIKDNIRFLKFTNGWQSKVFVSFTVSETGELIDIKLEKGLGKLFDEEAVRLIKSMPNWNPAKQGGKSVRIKYTLPINFDRKWYLDKKNNW